MIKEKIQALAKDIFNDVVANRRHLHSHPELSFHEVETSVFVANKLEELGLEYHKMADTGLVALIKGDKPSDQVVALRADMDALPITEANDVPYKSQNPGVMHACGHDVHTSSLLGVAKILTDLKSEFGGTIKLIFQPAEEKLPGGASLMIQEGVLENPKPQAVIGQHVMPLIDAGKVGFRAGKYMASTDELYVTVRGKGGHGAQPQQNVDPVIITAHILTALQTIISRSADPKSPSVLSFGKVIANGATNVIPNEVYLEGTFRTMDEKWRSEAHMKIKKMAEGIAESMGGSCEFNIMRGYPFLINEEKLTAVTRANAEDYLGKENVLDLDIWMAAEDFAYYSQVADSCFYRLGTRNEARGITSSVHTPTLILKKARWNKALA
jgi:amidohydrolase